MIRLQVPLDSLRTQLALVERKLFPRLEPDDRISAYFKLQAALLTAKAAVRLDKFLRGITRLLLPASGRRVVRVGSELLYKTGEASRRLSHALPPLYGSAPALRFCACKGGKAPT